MKEFRPAKKRVEASVGESVRILREPQELSQSRLSVLTGIPQATISAIENGRVNRVSSVQWFLPVRSCAILPCSYFPAGKIRLSAPHNITVEESPRLSAARPPLSRNAV